MFANSFAAENTCRAMMRGLHVHICSVIMRQPRPPPGRHSPEPRNVDIIEDSTPPAPKLVDVIEDSPPPESKSVDVIEDWRELACRIRFGCIFPL